MDEILQHVLLVVHLAIQTLSGFKIYTIFKKFLQTLNKFILKERKK